MNSKRMHHTYTYQGLSSQWFCLPSFSSPCVKHCSWERSREGSSHSSSHSLLESPGTIFSVLNVFLKLSRNLHCFTGTGLCHFLDKCPSAEPRFPHGSICFSARCFLPASPPSAHTTCGPHKSWFHCLVFSEVSQTYQVWRLPKALSRKTQALFLDSHLCSYLS